MTRLSGLFRCGGGRLLLAIGGFAVAVCAVSAQPNSPASPSAAQPSIPQPWPKASKSRSPDVEKGGDRRPELTVRKGAMRAAIHMRHARHHRVPPLERPTLAGVELVAPLAPPPEPPHFTVPVPAYPLDTLTAAFITPPPPIVCRHAPREPYVPDPHLYRERTVACEPDTP